MANVSGSRGLNFSGSFDVQEILKNQQKVIQGFGDLKEAAERAVNAGGVSVQKGLADPGFQTAIRNARLELERLKKEEQELTNQTVATGKETAELTRKFQANRLAQQELSIAAKQAKTNQQAASGSYREAQQRLTALGKTIREAQGGFNALGKEQRARIKEYRELNDRLKEFDKQLGNNQRNVGNYASALDGLKGYAASFLGLSAIIAGGRAIVQSNAEISDSLSDVQRTTGLTAKAADDLSVQLKKIDTRTSLKGLLDIAVIGGQLGIASDQLVGFTRAVDQLAVALSGELQGGAEGIAKSLGVLDNVFKVSASNGGDVEKSYNQIGSAILGLGQSGLATGDFLTDFGERVGGLAKQAGLSLPVILSYGAVLQENGVSAEVAGTSFKRLLSALVTNRGKFLAVAQLADANQTLESFTNLINTDAKSALDLFFQGLAKGGTTTSGFNDILKSLKLTQGGVSQAIAALANNQVALNGHIQDATKDFNNGTIAAQQYEIRNDNLAGSIDKLGNAFTNLTTDPNSNLAQFFKNIVDAIRLTVVKFGELVNSASWKEFWTRLSNNSKTGTDLVELPQIFNRTSAANQANQGALFDNFNEERLRAQGAEKFNQNIERLRKNYELALDAYSRYAAGVASGRLNEDKTTVKQYKDNSDRAKSYYEQLLVLQKKFGFDQRNQTQSTGGETSITGTTTEAEQRKAEAALAAQRKLQSEIDALTNKGRAKRLSDDEQELADIQAKYDKIREKAIAFNKASSSRGLRVDTGGLLFAQSTEETAKRDEQAAKNLKTNLDIQRSAYTDYEKYITDFGKIKANERYADLTKNGDSYLKYLQNQRQEITKSDENGRFAIINDTNRKQVEEIDKRIKAETEAEQKRSDALLKEFMSYADARRILEEKRDFSVRQLTEKNDIQAAENARNSFNKQIYDLDVANMRKLESYQALFSGIESLSKVNALKLISDTRKAFEESVKSGKIVDPDEIQRIRDYLAGLGKAIKNGAGQELIAIANSLDQVVSTIGDANSGFAKMLSTLANVLGQVGNIKKGIADFNTARSNGDGIGQLTSGLGILGFGISIFKSVFSLFDRSQQREEQAAYARNIQNKQTEALNKALERQVALLDQVYGTERITNYDLAIRQSTENQEKYASQLAGRLVLTGNKTLDDLITQINEGKTTGFGFNQNLVNELISQGERLPSDINELQRLLDEGKLDANTEVIVNNLIKARDTAQQLRNNLNAELTGTTLDRIADDFISTLTDGTQDFGKTFEDTIQKSIINGFKGELIKNQLQAFYNQFADLSKGGLTEQEIEVLRKSYIDASEKAKADLQALSKATGIDLTASSTTANTNSLKGSIKASLTEDTGTILAGVFRGVQLSLVNIEGILKIQGVNNASMVAIANNSLNSLVAIQNNTLRIANNTDKLTSVDDSLLLIAKNTTNSLDYQLRAAGKFGF